MNRYVIYCTEEQTMKSIKLGAPIEIIKYDSSIINTVTTLDGIAIIPTAEQMIGWLEDQGLYFSIECIGDYVYEVWTKDKDKSNVIINSCINTRKEAMLAAIDVALAYMLHSQTDNK